MYELRAVVTALKSCGSAFFGQRIFDLGGVREIVVDEKGDELPGDDGVAVMYADASISVYLVSSLV